jgi:hypothetical protein
MSGTGPLADRGAILASGAVNLLSLDIELIEQQVEGLRLISVVGHGEGTCLRRYPRYRIGQFACPD